MQMNLAGDGAAGDMENVSDGTNDTTMQLGMLSPSGEPLRLSMTADDIPLGSGPSLSHRRLSEHARALSVAGPEDRHASDSDAASAADSAPGSPRSPLLGGSSTPAPKALRQRVEGLRQALLNGVGLRWGEGGSRTAERAHAGGAEAKWRRLRADDMTGDDTEEAQEECGLGAAAEATGRTRWWNVAFQRSGCRAVALGSMRSGGQGWGGSGGCGEGLLGDSDGGSWEDRCSTSVSRLAGRVRERREAREREEEALVGKKRA